LSPPRLRADAAPEAESRDKLVARWLSLTRDVLPAMASDRNWPIALDHCFMRVCLDAALGSPWTKAVGRPAIRTMSEAQIAAAIAVAEAIVEQPDLLSDLNRRSLDGRRAARTFER
jgi:hypothetical protein